jgi:iron complex outermembrane receptor protein
MDGRALYTPSFNSVFWDVQDTLMQDIDRIEVIRGPGGALWGVNAVNGVINIITRSARETQGGELIAAVDDGSSRSASLRYGDKLGEKVAYRLYTKYVDASGNEDYAGHGTADAWHLGRLGLRAEWSPADRDHLSSTTEVYDGRSGETLLRSLLVPPYATIENAEERVSGFFTTVRWQRRFAGGRELQTQFYYDSSNRDTVLYGERRKSAVLELQYHFPLGAREDIVAGAGYRHNRYEFSTTDTVTITPQRPSNSGYNAFVQDDIQLIPEQLALTLGVDVEHNPLSDKNLDVLPSGRLLWSINGRNHLWAAVTKAIGTPSYQQTGASVRNVSPVVPPGDPQNPFPVPLVTTIVGNPDFRSERLVAYELGYRTQFGAAVTLDTTVFLHDYQDLWGQTPNAVYCEPSQTSVFANPLCVLSATDVVIQSTSVNGIRARSSGLEVAADWSPAARLRFRATYTYLKMNLEPRQPGPGLAEFAALTQGQSPKHQFSLRSDLSLAHRLDLDASLRYVGQLQTNGIGQYWSADAHAVWHATDRVDVALTGRNLLQPSHAEFISEFSDVVPTAIERTLGAQVRWTF